LNYIPTDSVLRRHYESDMTRGSRDDAVHRQHLTGEVFMRLQDINLSFKGVKAISGISFDIMKGEVCALIGPNGAGKSSMLNIINGIYTPQTGYIILEGVRYKKMRPRRMALRGVARTFQNIALFQGMTTLDNIMTGRNLKMKSTFWEQALFYGRPRREEIQHRRRVEEIIEFLQIQAIRNTPVSKLPYGLQKRVEIGRALASEPRLLLLDEPMAGMNLEEKKDMSCFIMEINREFGTTIVLIEHDMGVVMDISDHVVVMDYGRKICDGPPHEVKNNQEVIEAYLGVKN